MILITITNEVIGKGHPYEELYRKGRRKLVPSYRASAHDVSTSEKFEFAVIRDASRIVFGENENRYGRDGECPPSLYGSAYYAYPGIHSRTGTLALRLYDAWSKNKSELMGAGSEIRTHIMIHIGPGRSRGCLSIAGGQRGHSSFELWFRQRLGAEQQIRVVVEEI